MGMALRAFLVTVFVAVVVSPALATDYMVGDQAGWRLNFNYTTWAQGKDFRVGDTITFMYTPPDHNVLKVMSGPDFKNCLNSNASEAPHTSGSDKFTLKTPGKKWYICDIGDHCSQGMKLVITVSAADGPIPSPSPEPGSSAASELSVMKSCTWILLLMAIYRMIMA